MQPKVEAIFQKSDGSNCDIATTEPPERMGARMLRAMPPMWYSGIWLQHMSEGSSSHAAPMHTAPTIRSSSKCGTTFLLPVEPLVCRRKEVSERRIGSRATAAAVLLPVIVKSPAVSSVAIASATMSTSPSLLASATTSGLEPDQTSIAFAPTLTSSVSISAAVPCGLRGAQVQ